MTEKIGKIAREKRHRRVRRKIAGTVEMPRVSVYRSLSNMYSQIIDDENGVILLAVSTLTSDIRDKIKTGGNREAAKVVGRELAMKAKEKGIKKVVFDRSGYHYHGRVKELAEAAREGGLEF